MIYTEFAENSLIALYQECEADNSQYYRFRELIEKYGLPSNERWLEQLAEEWQTEGLADVRSFIGSPLEWGAEITGRGMRRIEAAYGTKDGVGTVLEPIQARNPSNNSRAVDQASSAPEDPSLRSFNVARKRLIERMVEHGSAKIFHPVLSASTISRLRSPDYDASSFGPLLQERVIWLARFLDIPASDRLVALDHNSAEFAEIKTATQNLSKTLIESNDVGKMTSAGIQVAIREVQQIEEELAGEFIRPEAFWDRTKSTLSWIGREAAGALVGAAAIALLAMIATFFGFGF